MTTRFALPIARRLSLVQGFRCNATDAAPKLTGDQKAKLRLILPTYESEEVKKPVPTASFDIETKEDTQTVMDEIRARGLLKYNKAYDPPATAEIERIVSDVMSRLCGSVDWQNVNLSQNLDLKLKVLNELGNHFKHQVLSSDLHKIVHASDVVEFFSTPVSNLTPYAKMARNKNLPPNLSIREHPVRFHPDDTEAIHGGVTAYPGEGGNVISLRNKRLYRSFKPKKEWYDYDDQAFDFTRPDKDMPWDTSVSQKMDRYVDRKYKLFVNK